MSTEVLSGYAIENAGLGKYLNIADEAGNDVRLVGNDSKRLWGICHDESDPNARR